MADELEAQSAQDSEPEKRLILICQKDAVDTPDNNLIEEMKVLLAIPGINVESTDKDGMTPLMHASFSGKREICELLLDKGADVNNNDHSQGYTALMFATISGHEDVVQLLLDHGARPDVVNKINRTAAQMGGFVGQTECVQLINNFFPLSELNYFTQPQGLEVTPKLDPSLLLPVHQYIITTNIHPVNLLLILQSKDLIQHHSQVCKVLDILRDKSIKDASEVKENLSLKLHLLSYTLKQSAPDVNGLMKSLLYQTDDGRSLELEKFLRECLKTYPHVHCILLKQLVSSIAKVPLGEDPTTISLFTSAVLGNRNYIDKEVCSTCGAISDKHKKCSKCKRVCYCNVECQRLAWSVGNHKRLCKKWTKPDSEN